MADELTSQNWADWWAEAATVADGLSPKKRLPPQSVVDALFSRFLQLRRKDTAGDPGATLVDHALSEDPGFKDRYARDTAASAMVAARSSILSYLHHGPRHVFPRPSVSDGGMIAVRDGKIVAAGGTVSGQHHLRALGELLAPGRPFVFTRCPVCERIFARKGRRLRCSLGCTQKANDDKREPEKRREQNREAARRYRERQRTEKAREVRRNSRKRGAE